MLYIRKMKNILILLVLAISVTSLTSCAKSDSDSEGNTQQVQDMRTEDDAKADSLKRALGIE